jgi:rod shape-determining protein MreC
MKRNMTQRIFIIVISVVLLFISVGMTKGGRGVLAGPEGWIQNGAGWIEGIFYTPFGTLFADGKGSKNTASPSVEELKLRARVNELTKENQELKEMLDYKKANRLDSIQARVVYRSPDRFSNRVVIDRGTDDGVYPKMPVVTPQGLIGRVQTVTSHMADIQLLTDSGDGPGIAAVIQTEKGEVLGIIEGYDVQKRRLIMKKVPVTATPKKGQIIVTSRLSDIYPGGILIGTVDEVKMNESQVEQVVYIKPSASFEQLDYVMVVKDPEKLQLRQIMQKKQ